MDDVSEVVHKLLEERVPFTVGYSGDSHAVVVVTDSVNNEAVRLLGELGAIMDQGGVFRILAMG